MIARPRQAQRDLPARRRQHPAQAALGQKPGAVDKKTPGDFSPGAALSLVMIVQGHVQLPDSESDTVATVLTVVSEPVMAAIALFHCA